jgi:TPR repeat protein
MMGRGVACFVVVCAVFAPAAAFALDGSPTPNDAPIADSRFGTAQQAFRRGVEAYRSGDVEQSVPALKYAAEAGHPLAQWKLAKMYADGDGVPHDDFKAYQYFLRVVENFDEESPAGRDRSVVSNAFVACGVYALKGIAARLKPDPQRAFDLFRFAATNFGDANAQYHLARMLLDGSGVARNAQQGARWLSLAAEKGHVSAQALLGRMLFNGQDGVARQRARGLMWLELARRRADPVKDKWIFDAHGEATALASDFDRDASKVYAQRFEARGD